MTRKELGERYRQIEKAVFAGEDHLTLGDGNEAVPVRILATGGKHAALMAKSKDDVRYSTIVTLEGSYPGKTYLVTYQLGSVDGRDNFVRRTAVEDGTTNTTEDRAFGVFW